MKRNFPPDINSEEAEQEQVEIRDRIEQLFSSTIPASNSIGQSNLCRGSVDSRETRNIPINSVGFLQLNERRIILQSLKGLDRYLICQHEENGYHYMEPYDALYSLEMNKLLLFHNEQPLSLAEAYQMLLSGCKDDVVENSQPFIEYLVFRHLNRIGYICTLTSGRDILDQSRIYNVYKRENLCKLNRKKILEKSADFRLIVKVADSDVCFTESEDDKSVGEERIRTLLALVDIDSNISFVEFNQLNAQLLNLSSK